MSQADKQLSLLTCRDKPLANQIVNIKNVFKATKKYLSHMGNQGIQIELMKITNYKVDYVKSRIYIEILMSAFNWQFLYTII